MVPRERSEHNAVARYGEMQRLPSRPRTRTLGLGDVWLAPANPHEGVGIDRMEA